MTERERKLLEGAKLDPLTRDEAAIKTAIDNAGSGGGGSELPTPGTAGNVLTSTGTAWESAAPTGGVEDFNVTFQLGEMPTTGKFALAVLGDVTIADIYAARAAGKNVYAICAFSETKLARIPLVAYEETDVFFSGIGHLPSGDVGISFTGAHRSNEDRWEGCVTNGLPYAGGANNQKIPIINGNAYDLTDYHPDFKVDITYDNGAFTAAHDGETVTVAEVYAAKNAGKNVFCVMSINGLEFTAPLTVNSQTEVSFGCVYYNGNTSPQSATPIAIVGKNVGGTDTWDGVGL